MCSINKSFTCDWFAWETKPIIPDNTAPGVTQVCKTAHWIITSSSFCQVSIYFIWNLVCCQHMWERRVSTEMIFILTFYSLGFELTHSTNLWLLSREFWYLQQIFPKSWCSLQSLRWEHLQSGWTQSTGWTWASCISENNKQLFDLLY